MIEIEKDDILTHAGKPPIQRMTQLGSEELVLIHKT
jgi:hypothetical protein